MEARFSTGEARGPSLRFGFFLLLSPSLSLCVRASETRVHETVTWGKLTFLLYCVTFSIVKMHLPHVNVSRVNTALIISVTAIVSSLEFSKVYLCKNAVSFQLNIAIQINSYCQTRCCWWILKKNVFPMATRSVGNYSWLVINPSRIK